MQVATNVRSENGYTVIRYHSTDVVRFNSNLVILDTGGWFSATTKRRMNQTARQYGLDYVVYARAFKWYASYKGHELPFLGNVLILNRSVK